MGDRRTGGKKDSPKTHKDLDVRQEAMQLARHTYSVTATFPKEERYGLTLQARRCSVSIPSNIAEGAARRSTKEFMQFLYVALGSVAELETQLLLARSMNFFSDESLFHRIEHVRKMLLGLVASLKRKPITHHPSLITPLA
jgi:four helix bundle protein